MSRSPTPRRRATLASLAAELEVSRTTISNAYNRPDQLSAELRERILATAKRLGYAGPDPVARSLRTRRAGAVGLVITEPLTYSFSDPAALNFVAGLAESCEEVGQGLGGLAAEETGMRVGKPTGLARDRLAYCWMAMAQARDRGAAAGIEESAAVAGRQPNAIAMLGDWHRRIAAAVKKVRHIGVRLKSCFNVCY